MIISTTGKPGQGMTFTPCTPPAKNDATASLAAPVVSGPGVCTYQGPWRPTRLPVEWGAIRSDWSGDWQLRGRLDAPEDLPRGSHRAYEGAAGSHWSDGYGVADRGRA